MRSVLFARLSFISGKRNANSKNMHGDIYGNGDIAKGYIPVSTNSIYIAVYTVMLIE